MTNFSTHIPLEDLADLAEGHGPIRETEAMSAHLTACAACATTLEQLKHVVNLMQSDLTENAPRDVIHRAIQAFNLQAPAASFVRRVLAVLSFDSFKVAPAFGTRSSQSGQRQLIYSFEDSDIDLHIANADKKWVISGQLLGRNCHSSTVEIEGAGVTYSTTLSQSCEFRLPAVPSGDYKLRLRLADIEVEVPRLEL